MKIRPIEKPLVALHVSLGALLVLSGQGLLAFPVITNVLETGGDNEATDTVPAKWTGVTYVGGVANEPVPGLAAGASYTVGLFGHWAPCYVDRNHRYTNADPAQIPSYLLGQEYIMSGNDNRDNTGYRLDISVATAVRVYMLIDNRLGGNAADPPTFDTTHMQWILDDGWTPVMTGVNHNSNATLPDEVAVDESADGTINNWFSIYTKAFPAGTFQIKQADNASQNMYGVVVVSISPPAPPANLTATSGDGKVTLNWSAAGGASGYVLKRSLVSGGPYEILATNSTTGYMDLAVVNGTSYYYVVSALNAAGQSADSNEVIGQPNIAPTGVVAVGGTNQVQVSWNPVPNADTYIVRRSGIGGGPYTLIASGITGTNYLDTAVQSGRTYFYVVSAQLLGGVNGGQSSEAPATTAPSSPNALSVSIWATTVLRVGWMTADPVVTQYYVEQSTDRVNFAPLATVPGNQKSYTNSGLTLNRTYYYRVQAQNTGGLSDYSTVASNTTPAAGWNINFANAINGDPTNNPAPTPPGYLQDISQPFGDRGNGYSYGWDRDITGDSRWRRNAASPDLRYDTFTHLQKIPVPSAVWELGIPNGFYWVHIVSGDPTAVNSIFQHNVEGVITRTYIPVSGAWWGEFTNTCLVSDGRLTITSGPATYGLANTNNKINFVDIYPAVPVPVGIDRQPQGQNLDENRPLTLSVTVTNGTPPPNTPFYGSDPISYQWYRNNTPLTGANSATLKIALAQMADSGNYYVVVSNPAGSVTSDTVAVTVNMDNTPPRVVSVGSVDGTTIGVCFDELIDGGTATDSFSYGVTDLAGNAIAQAAAAVLRPDGKSVLLTLDLSLNGGQPLSGGFKVTASVKDYTGRDANTGGGTTNGTVAGFTARDVGAPMQAGSTVSCKEGDFDVIAGGRDISNNSDQGHLTLMPRSGNWDVRVRINKLTPANAVSRAGLMARISFTADSPTLYLSVNPPADVGGLDQGEAGMRTTIGGATAAWGSSTTYVPVGIPNAWQRMTRAGNTFTAYRSSDGVNWIQFAQTVVPAPDPLLVGLGTTAHDNAAPATLAEYRNFHFVAAPTISAGPVNAAVGQSGRATFTVSATGPDEGGALRYQWRHDGGKISGAASSSLTLNNVQPGDAGSYDVVVSNTGGSTISAAATLTVLLRPAIQTASLAKTGHTLSGSFATENGVTYVIEYKNSLSDPDWLPLTIINGDGTVKTFTDSNADTRSRFYHIRLQ